MQLFKEEIENLTVLLNSRNIILNSFYRIQHDKNITHFLSEFFDNAQNFDSMEHMQKFYFKSNFKEINQFLNIFFEALFESNEAKGKSAEEICERCMVFPDSNGLSMMRVIGFIPLFKLIDYKIEFEKILKSDYDNEKNIDHFIKTREMLNNRKIKRNSFRNLNYTDYSYQGELTLRIKKGVKEKSEEIQEQINLICSEYEKSEDKNEFLRTIGKEYWNAKIDNRNELMESFKHVVMALSKDSDEKENKTD